MTMRALIAPDSYKGSLSAKEVATIIIEAASMEWPELECIAIPLADGGEGTVEALVVATGGQKVSVQVTGPLGKPIIAHYGILGDQKTVVIEISNVAGFSMVSSASRDPHRFTTYGLGEILLKAMEQGFRQFIIGLGGSATNDGGLGFLQALGAKFYDSNGEKTGIDSQSLFHIQQSDFSDLDPRLHTCSIIIASDVNNPLCGTNGSTAIYGPQKGIVNAEILLWDAAMQQYASVVEQELNVSIQHYLGAGAAGGMGFACMAIGAKLQSGAELISDFCNLEEEIRQSKFVITGEGRTDEQTLKGKLPYYVAQIAARYQVPVILLSASLGPNYEKLNEVFSGIHSIIPAPLSLDQAIENSRSLLFHAARQLFRTMRMATHLLN